MALNIQAIDNYLTANRIRTRAANQAAQIAAQRRHELTINAYDRTKLPPRELAHNLKISEQTVRRHLGLVRKAEDQKP